MTSISNNMNEILYLKIPEYLTPASLCSLSCGSRRLNMKCNDPALWALAMTDYMSRVDPKQHAEIERLKDVFAGRQQLISDKRLYVISRGLKCQGRLAWDKGMEKGVRIAEHPTSRLISKAMLISSPLIGFTASLTTAIILPQSVLVRNGIIFFELLDIASQEPKMHRNLGVDFFARLLRSNLIKTVTLGVCAGKTIEFIVEPGGISGIAGVVSAYATSLFITSYTAKTLRIYQNERSIPVFFRTTSFIHSPFEMPLLAVVAATLVEAPFSTRLGAALSGLIIHQLASQTPKMIKMTSAALVTTSVALPMILNYGKNQIKANKVSTAIDIATTTAVFIAVGTTTAPALAFGVIAAGGAKCCGGSVLGAIKGVLRFSVRLIPERAIRTSARIVDALEQRAIALISPYLT